MLTPGTASESGVWSWYEAVITTYFSKVIYTDCWSQRGERQKQNVSLSLFFFNYERTFKSWRYERFHLLVTKIKMTNWLPKETQKKPKSHMQQSVTF